MTSEDDQLAAELAEQAGKRLLDLRAGGGSPDELRKAGDTGKPAALEGENSPQAKSLYDFTRKVVERVDEIKAQTADHVIQIQ